MVFRLQVLLWSNRLLGLPALVFVLLIAFVDSRVRVQSASYLLPLLHIILSCIMITRLWSLNWKTKVPAQSSATTAAVADRSQNPTMHGVLPPSAATAAGSAAAPMGSRALLSSRPERAGSVGANALDRMHGLTSFRFPQGLGLDRAAVAATATAAGAAAGSPPLLGSTVQLGSFNTHNRRVMTGSATGHARKPSISSSSLSHHEHDAYP